MNIIITNNSSSNNNNNNSNEAWAPFAMQMQHSRASPGAPATCGAKTTNLHRVKQTFLTNWV